MDKNYGGFDKDIYYMGQLLGDQLVDGASFRLPDQAVGSSVFTAGMGNRINVFVDHNIDYIAADPPQFGIIPVWSFTTYERQVPNEVSDADFWKTYDPQAKRGRSANYVEMYPDFADASPVNPQVKAGVLNYKFLALPNKQDDDSEGFFSTDNGRTYLVFPIVAMGDYLRIRFYSMTSSGDPHEYGENDELRIWVARGHDAVGAGFNYSP